MKRILVVSLSLMSFAAVAAYSADSSMQSKGWVSDSMCGAKHAGTGASCAKKCVDGGSKPVFVDEAKKQVWSIDNPDAVKDEVGKHVTITATADPAAKSVHVTKISEIAE